MIEGFWAHCCPTFLYVSFTKCIEYSHSWAMWPDKSIKQLSSDALQTITKRHFEWYHTFCRSQSDLLERSRVEMRPRRSQVTVSSKSACRFWQCLDLVARVSSSRRLVKAFTCFRFSTTYSCYKQKQLFPQTDRHISPIQTVPSFLFPSVPPQNAGKLPSLPLAVSWCVSMLLGLACCPDSVRLRHMVTKICKIIRNHKQCLIYTYTVLWCSTCETLEAIDQWDNRRHIGII